MAISQQTGLVPTVNTSMAPMMGAPNIPTVNASSTPISTASNPAGTGAAIGAGVAGIGSAIAGATGNPGLSSILNSLGGLGQTAVGATAGTAESGAFDAQANNAIGAQNQYLGNAVNASNTAVGNTQGQLGSSQNYTQQGVTNQNNLLSNAVGYNTGSGVNAQQSALGNATNLNQAGINESNAAGTQLTGLLGPGATGASQQATYANTPGYQFAVQQGQNAINRQAAASGNLYSTSTLAGLSQYNTGMASQNYNNYVGQLMSMAGLGNQAAQNTAGLNVTTGQGVAQSYNNAATNSIQSGSIDAGLYNQGSINPLTAAGLQNTAYGNQGTYQENAGNQISDIYQNAGQYNAQGLASNAGALQQGLSPAGGITNAVNGISSLLGGNGTNYSSLLNGNNNTVAGLGNSGYTGTTGSSSYGNISDGSISANMNAQSGYDGSGYNSPLNYDTSGIGDLTDLSIGDGGNLLSNFSSAGGQAAEGTLGNMDVAGSLNIPSSSIQDGINSAVSGSQVNLGSLGSLSSLGGGLSGLSKLVSNPSNPVSDIQSLQGINSAVNTLTGGQGTLGNIASSAAPYLGLAGVGATIGMLDYGAIDPKNVPDSIVSMPAGGSIGKLPSGNSALLYNGLGVGAGSEETQGSGEIYQVGANGKDNWIGQQDSGTLEQDEIKLQQAKAGYTTGQSLSDYNASNTKTNTSNSGLLQNVSTTSSPGSSLAAQAGASQAQVKMTPAQQTAAINAATQSMSSIYNSTGGQSFWGQSVNEWLDNMNTLLGSMSQNGTYWGNT